METGEYTEAFAKFIISCREEYDVLCDRIREGVVPAGHSATISIRIPADWVDRIRFDVIAEMTEDDG